MGVWGLVEMDLGITVACIPVTGALWRHVHQSTLFTNASQSLKGLATWKKMMHDNDSSSMNYAMTSRKDMDPYLVVESSQPTTSQGITWVKTYGVSGLDALDTINEPDLEENRVYTGARAPDYHVSVDTGRH